MTKKRTHAEIKAEIKELQEIDNKTSDRVNHELNVMDQKEKEYKIEIQETQKKYHKIKASDLPVYRKQEWIINNIDGTTKLLSRWLYKLSVENGKLLCQRIEIKPDKPIEMHIENPEHIVKEIIYKETKGKLIDSDIHEWTQGVADLLTQLDSPEQTNSLLGMVMQSIDKIKKDLKK